MLRDVEGFRVLPVMRANRWPEAADDGSCNKYLHSLVDYLETTGKKDTPVEQYCTLGFGEYLKQRLRQAAEGPLESPYEVLIFDQFEELATLDSTDRNAKLKFFKQVGEALRDRNRWALFAMREDHIAEIYEYSHLIPTAFATRFRLNLLRHEQAEEAINGPTELAGRPFGADIVGRLVQGLATVVVQDHNENERQVVGDCVEPVQLQVVCRRLWDLHIETPLTEDDVTGTGACAVNDALADFYAKAVKDASEKPPNVPERVIRDWIEQHLILHGTLRGQVARGKGGKTLGLDNRAICALTESHLIREETRRGIVWIEITHDRLINPIMDSNARWRLESLTPFQQQAGLWAQKNRPEDMLLSGKALSEAETWVNAQVKLTEEEGEFLDACRKAREQLESIAKSNRELEEANWKLQQSNKAIRDQRAKTLWWSKVWKVTAIFAFLLLAASVVLWVKINKEWDLSQIRQLITAVDDFSPSQYARKLALALAASKLAQDHAPDGAEQFNARIALIGVLASAPPATSRVLSGHIGPIHRVAFTPDGEMLASASFDKTIRLWNTKTGDELLPNSPLTRHAMEVYSVVFSPDGRRMASSDAGGTIHLWRVEGLRVDWQGEIRSEDAHHGKKVTSLAFSPDSQKLASGGWDKQMIVWDVADPQNPRLLAGTGKNDAHDRPTSVVYGVGFTPGGQVVSGDWKGDVKIWNLQALEPGQARLNKLDSLQFGSVIYDVAISRDGNRLAVSGMEKKSSKKQGIYWRSKASLWHREDTHWLSTIGFDGVISDWDNEPSSSAVDFSPDNSMLVAVGAHRKSATLWELEPGFPKIGYTFPERLYAAAFNPKYPNQFALGGMSSIYLADRRLPPLPLTQFLPADNANREWSAVAISQTGGLVAALRAGSLHIWKRNADTSWALQLNRPLDAPPDASLAINRDGRLVAVSHMVNNQLRIVILDAENASIQKEMKMADAIANTKAKTLLAFGSNQNWLAIAHGEKIELYDTNLRPVGKAQFVKRDTQDAEVLSLAFSPDGGHLAAGLNQPTVMLWKATEKGLEPDGRVIGLTDGGKAQALVFHPSGDKLAVGSNRDIMVFDTQGKLEKSLDPRHEASIQHLLYGGTPKQTILISQDSEAKTYLWQEVSENYIPLRQTLLAGPNSLVAMDGSANVLVTSAQKNLLAWDLSQERLFEIGCAVPPDRLGKEDRKRFFLITDAMADPCQQGAKAR